MWYTIPSADLACLGLAMPPFLRHQERGRFLLPPPPRCDKMLSKEGGGNAMDSAKIEKAALHAIDKHRKQTGNKNLEIEIAKAIAAAIAEYDKQKSE